MSGSVLAVILGLCVLCIGSAHRSRLLRERGERWVQWFCVMWVALLAALTLLAWLVVQL